MHLIINVRENSYPGVVMLMGTLLFIHYANGSIATQQEALQPFNDRTRKED
jgi:K+-transporting ATPase c subunit